MENLLDRQKLILASIIELYVEHAQPVGSRTLSRRIHLRLSPATIRNEMSDLEELGYITHPHTSAGRVPTDKGYRFYVDSLPRDDMSDVELSGTVLHAYERKVKDLDELISLTAKILSTLSEQVAVVSFPKPEFLYFHKVELIQLDNRHLLVVWTSTNGIADHQMVEIPANFTPALCRKVARLLNEELKGLKFSEAERFLLERLASRRDALEQVYELARQIVRESLASQREPVLKLSGNDYILEKPEFQNVEVLRRLLNTLSSEYGQLRTMVWYDDQAGGGIQVHIGKENPAPLENCSVIVSPYQWAGSAVGVLALVGPRRMPYRRMFGILESVSRAIPKAFDRLIGGNIA